MKMLRKILVFGLAGVMILCVAACGTDAQTGKVSIETSDIPLETGSWKISGIGADETDVSARSLAIQFGAQIAVDEINGAGGIGGVMIEFSFLENEDRFRLVPSGSSVDIVMDSTDMFLLSLSDSDSGKGYAQYISENNIAGKAAVIYNSFDPCSVAVYERFTEEAGHYSVEIVAAEPLTSVNNSEFTAQLEKVRSAGAELLFLPINCKEAAVILTLTDAMEYKPFILGCDEMAGILELDNFDASLAEGVILPISFTVNNADEATVNFVTKYRQMYDTEPNQFSAAAYDAVYMIKAVLEEAGASPDMSMDEIIGIFKEALTAVTFDGLTGTGMTWNAEGEVSKTPSFMVIQGGAHAVCD